MHGSRMRHPGVSLRDRPLDRLGRRRTYRAFQSLPLCKGHHTVKHHGGWIVRQIEGSGGALEWISPAGRHYVVQPERRVPVFRSQSQSDAPF